MILAEQGTHFRRVGDPRRCVERPELLMPHGGRCRLGEIDYPSIA